MVERPYYYNQAYDDYAKFYHVNPYNNKEWQQQQFPQPNPAYFQTPFHYFSKPKQPDNWFDLMHTNAPSPQHKPNGLFAYFQDKDGQVDLDKMFSTVGQFANTIQQISPVVKQFGSMIKNFK